LYQQLSGGKKPGKREEVGREGVFEDRRVNGLASFEGKNSQVGLFCPRLVKNPLVLQPLI
jgi:hypothetical protein